VQVDSTLKTAALLGTHVSPADADRYVAEMTAAARLIGMPDGLAPASTAELDDYLAAIQPDLLLTPAAADTATFLLDPPGLDEDIAELWSEIRDGVLTVLPDWASDRYGFARPSAQSSTEPKEPTEPKTPKTPEELAERRAEIRQALGVFDAVTLGEPDVLEARQRIELRVRQAQAQAQEQAQAQAPRQ
jgi:hypothetical protein